MPKTNLPPLEPGTTLFLVSVIHRQFVIEGTSRKGAPGDPGVVGAMWVYNDRELAQAANPEAEILEITVLATEGEGND